MKKIYHNYLLREDAINGMYRSWPYTEDNKKKCAKLLSDPELFETSWIKMVKDWKYSAEHNLSNSSINHQARIWQATCCYLFWVNDECVVAAWRDLDINVRKEANSVADVIYEYWYQNIYNINLFSNA